MVVSSIAERNAIKAGVLIEGTPVYVSSGNDAGLYRYHVASINNAAPYWEKEELAQCKYNTTAYWTAQTDFVPKRGEIIVYSDYQAMTDGDVTVYIPGIKIGNGNNYISHLHFTDEDIRTILNTHINDTASHVSTADRTNWNNKVSAEVSGETITFFK